jgi:TRAP-type C4-dicarboxylate transport system substrate-binding protein
LSLTSVERGIIMKKLLAVLLCLTMFFALFTACGKSSDSDKAGETAKGVWKPPEGDNWWKGITFDKDVHVTFASAASPGAGCNLATEKAIELIKERSGGKIIIEIVYNGALGTEQSCFAQCMEGSIEMTGAGSGTISQYVPYLEVFQLPFLINSYEQEWAVMRSDEWLALRQKASDELDGVTIISMTEFGMRGFATIDKPIKTMADIKGLKIRSIGNPVIDEALSIVGANPVNITYTDLYSSLQNHVIDGEEINVTSVSMQKHYEVINYFSEIGFYPFLAIAVMSDKVIESLPDGYFDLIMGCFYEMDEWYMTKGIYDWDSQCRQDCIDNGVEFNTIEDKDGWIEKMAPLYNKKSEQDPMYKAFIEKARSLQGKQ